MIGITKLLKMTKKELREYINVSEDLLEESWDEIIKDKAEIDRLKMMIYQDIIMINEIEQEYNISVAPIRKMIQELK